MEEFSGGIEMDEDPLASCGDPCSVNMKVCAYDFSASFYFLI